jgi:hypothetical protein
MIEVPDHTVTDLHTPKEVEEAAVPFSSSAAAPVTRIGRVGDVGVVIQKTSPMVIESKVSEDRTKM